MNRYGGTTTVFLVQSSFDQTMSVSKPTAANSSGALNLSYLPRRKRPDPWSMGTPQKLISMQTPKADFQYAPEKCSSCDGSAVCRGGRDLPCNCCRGQGKVLVQQPSRRCPSCHGSGKRRALGWTKHCPLCAGRGWQNTKIITPHPAL